jgi:hypothetical protein
LLFNVGCCSIVDCCADADCRTLSNQIINASQDERSASAVDCGVKSQEHVTELVDNGVVVPKQRHAMTPLCVNRSNFSVRLPLILDLPSWNCLSLLLCLRSAFSSRFIFKYDSGQWKNPRNCKCCPEPSPVWTHLYAWKRQMTLHLFLKEYSLQHSARN